MNYIYRYFICLLFFINLTLSYANEEDSKKSINRPIRIVCIGDSITQGGLSGRPEYTFRLPLYKLLVTKKYSVDFIGARKNGISKDFVWPIDFDTDHEGFYGQNSEFIREAIKIDLKKINPPDIAIINIGTNDKDSNTQLSIIEPMRGIINELRLKNPRVKILIVQIPGVFKYLNTHFWIWWISYSLSTQQSLIHTVNLFLDWDAKADTFDGVHPNLIGQDKIAKLIFSELEPLLN